MTTRRRAFLAMAAASAVTVTLGSLTVALAADPAVSQGPGITQSSCEADGGTFAVARGGAKTCTTTTTITFGEVEHHVDGPFETSPDDPGGYIQYDGVWQSFDVMSLSTVQSQRGSGPVTETTTQSLDSYESIPFAVCMAWGYDSTGQRQGGGLTELNTPCIERGLLPPGAPVEQTWPEG